MVLEDAVKIIVDYWFSNNKKSVDTGNFEKIFKGKNAQENLPSQIGLELEIVGTKLKKKR